MIASLGGNNIEKLYKIIVGRKELFQIELNPTPTRIEFEGSPPIHRIEFGSDL